MFVLVRATKNGEEKLIKYNCELVSIMAMEVFKRLYDTFEIVEYKNIF